MTILGIDPGPEKSALVKWDGQKVIEALIAPSCECSLLFSNAVQFVACEHIQCMGMAVGASVFETAYWIGEFRSISRLVGCKFIPVYRSEVKMNLCQNMRAKDPNIRQALIDRVGPTGTKKNPGPLFGISSHLWSALAIAVTAYDRLQT